MEAALSRFQSETKEKVGKVIHHHRDSAQLLEKARNENGALDQENRHLQRLVEKLQRERDACYRSLELGRDRLAKMSSRKLNGRIKGELHFDGPHDLKSNATKAGLISHVVPELYLTEYSADHLLSLRAEEIAACLAMAAKSSLQESHDEASHLRSQVYRLEEEKEVELASLKAKIRSLERETGGRVSGSSYAKRSRYVIDPTD
jgi:cell division protein FtsB